MTHNWKTHGHQYTVDGEATDDFHDVCENCGITADNGNRNSLCWGSPYELLKHEVINLLRVDLPPIFAQPSDWERVTDRIDILRNTLIDLEGQEFMLTDMLEENDNRMESLQDERK